jgi:hypothetical protein
MQLGEQFTYIENQGQKIRKRKPGKENQEKKTGDSLLI